MGKRNAFSATACRTLEADLVLFHYRDLAAAERVNVENHIKSCAGCRAYLKELAALLPLTAKTDEPAQEFWRDYNRELRDKLDAATARRAWWPNVTTIIQPRLLVGFAVAAVLVLTITFGKNIWSPKTVLQDDELIEALPVAENLEFFRAMDLLDNLELLEFMGSQSDNAV